MQEIVAWVLLDTNVNPWKVRKRKLETTPLVTRPNHPQSPSGSAPNTNRDFDSNGTPEINDTLDFDDIVTFKRTIISTFASFIEKHDDQPALLDVIRVQEELSQSSDPMRTPRHDNAIDAAVWKIVKFCIDHGLVDALLMEMLARGNDFGEREEY